MRASRLSCIIAIALVILSSSAFAINAANHTPATLPKSVEFNGIKLSHAFEQAQEEQFIVEYIPAGETLEKWSTMFAVRKQNIPSTPLDHAIRLAQSITQRNPKLGANVIFHEDNPEKAMVTFIAVGGGVIEYNVWKFMKTDGFNGLVSYQFAVRNYGELSDDFRQLLNNTEPIIDAMRDYAL